MIKHTFYVKLTTTYDETAKKLIKDILSFNESEYINICSLEYWKYNEPKDKELKDMIDGVDA